MRDKTLLELYQVGKKKQQSIDFNEIGKFKNLEKEEKLLKKKLTIIKLVNMDT